MTNILTWHDPEWFDVRDGDYEQAFAASDPEYFTECEVVKHPGLHGEWFFMVKATSNLSEYPEVQDWGVVKDADEGKQRCEDCVQKILARNLVKKQY